MTISQICWRRAATRLLLLAGASCVKTAPEKTSTAAPRIESAAPGDSTTVMIPHPERFALVTAATEAVPDRLSGTCVVTPDVNRAIPIAAPGSGRVVDLRA